MARAELLFITGGVRSGKSAYAEKQVKQLADQYHAKRLVYLATGVAFDDEMRRRITRHKLDRDSQHLNWVTLEQPTEISRIVKNIQPGDVLLWDCVTTWLTNEFYEGYETGLCHWQQPEKLNKRIIDMKNTILQLQKSRIPIVIVSNEVLDEPLSTMEDVKLYQQYLGKLHQWFVHVATQAIEIEYGFVHQWK
ncbi:bifunctional adenosylcobinamide kinase/adenosylcobinamide-phosphate guanylyltransferase [Rummeliibacillus sp. JY-2-4R]